MASGDNDGTIATIAPPEENLMAALEEELRELLGGHGLRLEAITWKRDFKQQKMSFGVKVAAELFQQAELALT